MGSKTRPRQIVSMSAERWTGLLQSELGDGYTIIEDGLCGRTVLFPDPEAGRFAAEPYFSQSLQVHTPLDAVILALGTNDLKASFALSPGEIGLGIKQLAEKALMANEELNDCPAPAVLLACPPKIGELDGARAERFEGARTKQTLLPMVYCKVANEIGANCCEATANVSASDTDSVHLDLQGHIHFFNAILNTLEAAMKKRSQQQKQSQIS